MTQRADDGMTTDRMQRIAAAQARRDRGKLNAAHREIQMLQNNIIVLENSLSRRAGAPARRLIRLLRRVFYKPPAPAAQSRHQPEPAAGLRGLALVIDHNWPRPDRDSGSLDIVNLVQALTCLGFDTILAASREHDGEQPARDRLIAQGVRCLMPNDAVSLEAFIARNGSAISLCVLCRVYCGGEFFERLQLHAPQARLVFNSIDLNYLREERRALLQQDETLLGIVQQLRAREELLVRGCDATFVVSASERDLLAATTPESLVVQMPLARPVHFPSNGFDARAGIGFIGGFAHAPNVDAVRYFLQAIWPRVQAALPECEFSIVGSDIPAGLADGCTHVRILGYQEDLAAWFESLRLTVAPLRFGAGAKGKVASSLAHGVPCIVSSIASEGMSLIEQEGVAIRDDPSDFAAALVQAYTNKNDWVKMSSSGLSYAERMLSPEAWQARLNHALNLIGF